MFCSESIIFLCCQMIQQEAPFSGLESNLSQHDGSVCGKVLELAAEDRDTGENAQLTFSVVAGDQEQKFYMLSQKQEQRGTLRLKKRLDYERHSEQKFNLTLKVRFGLSLDSSIFWLTEKLSLFFSVIPSHDTPRLPWLPAPHTCCSFAISTAVLLQIKAFSLLPLPLSQLLQLLLPHIQLLLRIESELFGSF